MPRANSRNQRHQQRGIALIEALVGMLIFAFGILGLIGLQASMTRAQSSAHYRADASNLASELFGLIQTDAPANLASYNGDQCAAYARCKDWLRRVGVRLPSGQATVAAATATGTITVTVSWAQGSDRNSFSTTMIWQP
ncbi:prepilin-type N-terminal cleavage/methylation domain-containing protein [Pelomonas sp. KK5]|uniref:type IV pilus modification PilV family protein n=1 Tax=Pelomonas sp. KK5 TaxID=1855730 RepID=UPI00097C6F29|nr:prepilin-type N-terminal cleavage/methylation domain-containing protein [Pelomonas sp. KK5]